MPETQIAEIRRNLPTSPLKRLVEYEIEKTRLDRMMNNRPKDQNEVEFERGVQEGLSIAKGILNRKP